MRSASRPVLTAVLGFTAGVTLLILVPNLIQDLLVRQSFGEFGSRAATVRFDLFLWGVTLLPAAAGFSLPLIAVRRRLRRRQWPIHFGSGLLCGLVFGLAAGIGLLGDWISALRALGFLGGPGSHLAAAAATGLALGLVPAGAAAARRFGRSRPAAG